MKFEDCKVGQRIVWNSPYTGLKKGEIMGVNPNTQAVVVLWDGATAEHKYVDTVSSFNLDGAKTPKKEFRVGQRIQWKEEGLVGVVTGIESGGPDPCIHVMWDGDKRPYPYRSLNNDFEPVEDIVPSRSDDKLYSFFAAPCRGNCPCNLPPPCKYHPEYK